jgi:hypothetical protein
VVKILFEGNTIEPCSLATVVSVPDTCELVINLCIYTDDEEQPEEQTILATRNGAFLVTCLDDSGDTYYSVYLERQQLARVA